MTAQAAPSAVPALAGLDLLERSFHALHAAPLGGRHDVNGALRLLLDQHPELELLPLELLAAELVAAGRADTVTRRTRPA